MSAIPLAEAVEKARRAIDEARWSEAKAIVEAVRSAAPEAATTQLLWGRILLEEDAEAAERVLLRAIEIDPEDAEAWALLAEARRRRGERETARTLLQVAWECAPWQREYAERLAAWYREDGQDGQLWLSRAALAALYVSQGWWTRAGEECRTLLEEGGERWDLRQRLCLALWWLGARDEAAAQAEGMLAERPEAVGALIVAALAARERGDEATARQHCELLWALDPLGEAVTRYVPEERWEERAWLGVAEPVLVEERWTVPSVGETALLWELPTDEELAAARPPDAELEEALAFEIGLAAEEAATGAVGAAEAESEPVEAGVLEQWELPSEEEIEAARPPAEVERGWTSMLEELVSSGIEPLAIEGLESAEEAPAGAAPPGAEVVAETVLPGMTAEAATPEAVAGNEEAVAEAGEMATEAAEAAATSVERTAVEEPVVSVSAAAAEESQTRDRGEELITSAEGEFERLLATGAVEEAVRLAQRVVHRGGEEAEALIPHLERLVAEGGRGARQAAMAVGAFYRRRGETGRASRYYELALRLRSE
ncbi:hypothetical protein HRbin27_00079 [bacterium HR27]|nr:hypothetical protein HRbin27_00079 [bacterium HR27]